MNFTAQNLLLYAVTDRAWVGRQTLLEQIESALKGGATLVQLRERIFPGWTIFGRPPRPQPCATATACL